MAKLVTINTHSWMEENPLEKLEQLAQAIVKEDYDIICLQEVNQEIHSALAPQLDGYCEIKGSPAIHEDHYALNLVRRLKEYGRDYNWSWAYNHIGYDRYHEGVAILAKAELAPQAVLVSNADDEYDYHTRRALVAETILEGKKVQVASLHLSWWDKGFQEEWARLEGFLVAQKLPVILMGDFNNPQGNQGYKRIMDSLLSLRDSHVAAEEVVGDHTIQADIDGWEGNQQLLKVDHVFTNLDLPIKKSIVVFDGKESPVISDHFGVMVEITR